MDTKEMQSFYEYLKKKRDEYQSADKKNRALIADQVRSYSLGMSAELYAQLNNDSASGLFRSNFFESDLDCSISILQEMINCE